MTYFIVLMKITNDQWVEEYMLNVPPILEKYDGLYVSNSNHIEILEGQSNLTDFVSIVQFPEKQNALDFHNDLDYQPYLKNRMQNTEAITLMITE